MPSPQQRSGIKGEELARKYLEDLGYQLIEQQWHSRYGEIDLIMMDRDELVFVEVKLRSTQDFGYPEEMVSLAKSERLQKTALAFLENTKYDRHFWRFDTIAITRQRNRYEITHFKDTIREDY